MARTHPLLGTTSALLCPSAHLPSSQTIGPADAPIAPIHAPTHPYIPLCICVRAFFQQYSLCVGACGARLAVLVVEVPRGASSGHTHTVTSWTPGGAGSPHYISLSGVLPLLSSRPRGEVPRGASSGHTHRMTPGWLRWQAATPLAVSSFLLSSFVLRIYVNLS